MPRPTLEQGAEEKISARTLEPGSRDTGPAPEAGSLLALQAAAGNGAVAGLVAELKADPAQALAAAGSLPPALLLMALGHVSTAVSRTAAQEREALASRPPGRDLAFDHPPPRPQPDRRAPSPPEPVVAEGAEPSDLPPHRATLERTIGQVHGQGRQEVAAPMGEDVIFPSEPAETLHAAVPVAPGENGQATAAPTVDDRDGATSVVARLERGAEIRSAVALGIDAMAARREGHARRTADARAQAAAEMDQMEKTSASEQLGERAGARQEILAVRTEWDTQQREAADRSRREADVTIQGALRAAAREHAEARGEPAPAAGGPLGWAGAALGHAKELAGGVMEKARQAVASVVHLAGGALAGIGSRLVSAFSALRDRFRRAIRERIERARASVNAMVIALKRGVQRTLNGLGAALATSTNLLSRGLHEAVDGVKATVRGAMQFARGVVGALGAFAVLIKDVAIDPGRWVSNLGAAVQEGLRHHLWTDIKEAVQEWFTSKVEAVVGLGAAVWNLLRRGGVTLAQIGHVAWEALKAAVPAALISILIEKLVSLIVPAAGAALLIVQAIQAGWASLSRIVQAFDAFMKFLRSVRWGGAGPLFGKALAAGTVALIELVSNFLIQRLQSAAVKVAGGLRAMARRIAERLRAAGKAVTGTGEAIHRTWASHKYARQLIKRARMQAPKVRGDLQALAAATGGKLEGLRYELKTQRSLYRKFSARMAQGAAPQDISKELKDVLRYTMTFDEGRYSRSVKEAIKELEAQGYKEVAIKNFWGQERYMGVNAAFETSSGQRFELQFHTSGEKGSWRAKQFETHPLYEEWRRTNDPERERELYDLMVERWKKVQTPEGALEIGMPVKRP